MRHYPVKHTVPPAPCCTISNVGETKSSLWAVNYYCEYRTENGVPFFLSTWDLMKAQTNRPACTVSWCWLLWWNLLYCSNGFNGLWLFAFFFNPWALRGHTIAVTFRNVEVLEAQDIIHQSLGNSCGFAQVAQKCRRGLLTLRREKAHFQAVLA